LQAKLRHANKGMRYLASTKKYWRIILPFPELWESRAKWRHLQVQWQATA
jgi:hypothetical protein